jgi:hypothetical protein
MKGGGRYHSEPHFEYCYENSPSERGGSKSSHKFSAELIESLSDNPNSCSASKSNLRLWPLIIIGLGHEILIDRHQWGTR